MRILFAGIAVIVFAVIGTAIALVCGTITLSQVGMGMLAIAIVAGIAEAWDHIRDGRELEERKNKLE
jgi:hypothetical protein